jgi:hypothetical protein
MEIPCLLVDFEASGIAPDSYPIEIAIVSVEAEYQALIMGCAGHAWDFQRIAPG